MANSITDSALLYSQNIFARVRSARGDGEVHGTAGQPLKEVLGRRKCTDRVGRVVGARVRLARGEHERGMAPRRARPGVARSSTTLRGTSWTTGAVERSAR